MSPTEKPQADFNKDRKLLEKEVERPVSKKAQENGWKVYKWKSVNNAGVLDRIFIKQGKCVFVEFKRPGGKTTKLQDDVIQELKDENMITMVIDNRELGYRTFL
ncbi:VRR-NUC domain-containing protein [Candidatus Pacearchaeota archaeon]|nr:VRR-NUC domain-containing protein [Candidatus Pacearchaeota archaeon]